MFTASTTSARAQSKSRVVVLGAGYSGLLAAIRLAGKARQAEVTLVNPRHEFIERVRLHRYAAGQTIRWRKIGDILGHSSVSFVRSTASSIDLDNKVVVVNDKDTGTRDIEYDYLVYAVGSQTDLDEVPGARDFAYSLNLTGGRSVDGLRERLKDTAPGTRLVVVGGGPTGIESAAEFAESYPHLGVTLATRGDLLPLFPGKPREYVVERLEHMAVRIRIDTEGSRLLRMHVPTEYGGDDLTLSQALDVIEELARADGSTGWTRMIGSDAPALFACLPRTTFDAVYADGPDVIGAGATAPKDL
jgi:NADH dehydrogenase FAD-containing subunit